MKHREEIEEQIIPLLETGHYSNLRSHPCFFRVQSVAKISIQLNRQDLHLATFFRERKTRLLAKVLDDATFDRFVERFVSLFGRLTSELVGKSCKEIAFRWACGSFVNDGSCDHFTD